MKAQSGLSFKDWHQDPGIDASAKSNLWREDAEESMNNTVPYYFLQLHPVRFLHFRLAYTK